MITLAPPWTKARMAFSGSRVATVWRGQMGVSVTIRQGADRSIVHVSAGLP
jgi:hypothetical protein